MDKTASKANTHNPNGYSWDHPLGNAKAGNSRGDGSGGSSKSQKSGIQRKRGTENEGNGSPAKMRKDDTPASKTAQGMEKLHMEDAEIVGKSVID